jgi:hypothetical protein
LQIRRGIAEACQPYRRIYEENQSVIVVFNDLALAGELWWQMMTDLCVQTGKPFNMLQQACELPAPT